jgi:hypothetical protein
MGNLGLMRKSDELKMFAGLPVRDVSLYMEYGLDSVKYTLTYTHMWKADVKRTVTFSVPHTMLIKLQNPEEAIGLVAHVKVAESIENETLTTEERQEILDRLVHEWHFENAGDGTLQEYLKMNDEQYQQWNEGELPDGWKPID